MVREGVACEARRVVKTCLRETPLLPACVLGAAGLPAALGYSGACLDFVASNGAHALLHTGADVVLNLPGWLAAPG